MSKEKRVVFFEGKSWYHRTKELQDDLTTKYGKKGGFETPEEAEKSYWEYEKRYQKKQRNLQIAKMQKTDVMLGDYLEYWFENIFSPRIETTTRMVGAYTLYNLILPSMEADIKLRYVSVEYLDALLERVAKICPSAGNKGRELLSIAMKDAARDKFISYNPMPETKPYPRAKPKVRVLGKEKLKVFLEAASKNPWYLEILLGLFCGLRKGEILGLKFQDFDFEKQTVTISKSYQRIKGRDVITDPKTPKSNRVIQMPAFLCDEMQDYIKSLYAVQPTDRIFTVTKSYLHREMDRGAKEAGVKRIRIHYLRHSHISLLIDMGFTALAIADRVGHESIDITYRYAHLFPTRQTEMANKLDLERKGA